MTADWSEPFETARPRLRAIAYRMLGSLADADDALQDAWLRLDGVDPDGVDNADGWLTTVVARVCLNMLRARHTRRDEDLVADPVVDPVDDIDPEHEALIADAVGLAMFVVMTELPPNERLAFVLHDVFGVPFAEIAPIVDRSVEATRQLGSRARRRIQAARPLPDAGLSAQRETVDAFFAAARAGDVDRLVSVLHPDVVLRGDFGPGGTRTVSGAQPVARLATGYAAPGRNVLPANVNGAAGAVIVQAGQVASVMGFIVTGGVVTAIDVLADPDRLARLDLRAVTASEDDHG